MTSTTLSNNVPTPQAPTAELSWEQVATGEYPMTPAQQLFYTVVIATAAKAKASMPEANGRVEKARDLVLGGLVQPGPEGRFTIRSPSARALPGSNGEIFGAKGWPVQADGAVVIPGVSIPPPR